MFFTCVCISFGTLLNVLPRSSWVCHNYWHWYSWIVLTYIPLDMTLHMYPWLTGSYSLSDDSLYMYIIVHISCVIIPVYFTICSLWLDHIVNTYVHYLPMSPDICYFMYTLILICPSPHRRMISPLCSTFQYYPQTNIIYLAASICM